MLRQILLPLAALAAAGTATAAGPTMSVSELTHCAGIVPADQRLACYDTLAVAKMQPAAAPAATKVPATGPAAAAAAPAAASAAAATTAAASPATAAGAGSFGMTNRPAPVEQSTQLITAHVVAGSGDRMGNNFVTLDNGQTWTYVDINGPAPSGSEVTIRRGSLGSYLLTTMHHSFRAQRTQ